MNSIATTRRGKPGSGYNRARSNNSETILKHFPIFGNIRANCKICFIYCGLRDCEKAEAVNRINSQIAAVIMLPDFQPKQQIWDVSSLHCLIVESGTPPRKLIEELATELFKSGATTVYDLPDVDFSTNLATFDTLEQIWRIERPHLRTFVRKEVTDV